MRRGGGLDLFEVTQVVAKLKLQKSGWSGGSEIELGLFEK